MAADSQARSGPDWRAWHARYDEPGPLARRLVIVQRLITTSLDQHTESPLRVISMCAGEGRDILGALAAHRRRDITGRLVELDPVLAERARARAAGLGLTDLEVRIGDAGETAAYEGAVPADLVLVCGVFGNIDDSDVEATLRALPMLCSPGATVLWTRHRRQPDLTVAIRGWLTELDFENAAFEPVEDAERMGAVGMAHFRGQPQAFREQHLFTFTRDQL